MMRQSSDWIMADFFCEPGETRVQQSSNMHCDSIKTSILELG